MSKSQIETCPRCGAPWLDKETLEWREETGGLVKAKIYACRSYSTGYESPLCLRNQLDAAEARNADLARQLMDAAEERARTYQWQNAAVAESKKAQVAEADNANLRSLLEQCEWGPSGCPVCSEFESDGHAEWCELGKTLSSSPANPYAAVVEAAREYIECNDKALKRLRTEEDFVDIRDDLNASKEKLRNALAHLPGGDARG